MNSRKTFLLPFKDICIVHWLKYNIYTNCLPTSTLPNGTHYSKHCFLPQVILVLCGIHCLFRLRWFEMKHLIMFLWLVLLWIFIYCACNDSWHWEFLHSQTYVFDVCVGLCRSWWIFEWFVLCFVARAFIQDVTLLSLFCHQHQMELLTCALLTFKSGQNHETQLSM